jgi:hypothetical protein
MRVVSADSIVGALGRLEGQQAGDGGGGAASRRAAKWMEEEGDGGTLLTLAKGP